MFFHCKVTKKSRNMQIFDSKKPSAATSATLLTPLLPPLNTMKIRVLNLKVAVVAVKSFVWLVKGYWVIRLRGYLVIGLLGYSVDKWIGCSNVIRTGCSNVIRIGCSNVIRIGCSNGIRIGYPNVIRIGQSVVKWIGCSVSAFTIGFSISVK